MTQISVPNDKKSPLAGRPVAVWLIISQVLILLASPLLLLNVVFLGLGAQGYQGTGPLPEYIQRLQLGVELGFYILPIGTLICIVLAWLALGWKHEAAAATITALPLLAAVSYLAWLPSLSSSLPIFWP